MSRIAATLAFALFAATTSLATATPPETPADPPPPQANAQAEETTQAASAMRVYIDPETGAFTDKPVTEEQRQAAAADAASFREDDDNVRVVHHADGSTTAYLDGRFEQSTVASTDANGKLESYCADADHAQQGEHRHPDAAEAERSPATEQDVR